MRKGLRLTLSALLLLSALSAAAQNARDFREACDSLSARCFRRFGVKAELSLKKTVARKDSGVNFYFSKTLSDFPWHNEDCEWFRSQLQYELERVFTGRTVGAIYGNSVSFEEFATPELTAGGKPGNFVWKTEDPRSTGANRFINKTGAKKYSKGLGDRYIALWQSHGRYYNPASGRWHWQRAQLHRTVEDMYTQSYVLPFLIPMLENAGAYVMTPRERDTQPLEVICDNDPQFPGEREEYERRSGCWKETGSWSGAGPGFADAKRTYRIDENPFTMGTSRKAGCSTHGNSTTRWTPDIPERGNYAVYISYTSLDNSSTAAHYTVMHMGGRSEFSVNQKIGGGTWICLGTFEFAEGSDGYVELDNRGAAGTAVTADAVRFGGGIGKVERGGETSGYPCSAEGALYNMVWSGIDSTLWAPNWEGDYTRDYAARGAWTASMVKDRGIPFDLSLAFHSDAGTTPSDSTVGTLSIYTLKADGKRTNPGGTDRMASRTLCDFVQSQVVGDIRSGWDPKWSRREIWDRSYSESRTTEVPGMILELLSHQNFADMKYGLDPAFRFTVSRAVYKGILKFLGELYGCPYAVQPLPVSNFSCVLEGGSAVLNWTPTPDPAEPTAIPEGYLVYSRIDDGAWNCIPTEIEGTTLKVGIEDGHVYSFKVTAFNGGGESFPSEILSAGLAADGQSRGTVLIVNNFTRVSAPTWAESPGYAGFQGRIDGGVPWGRDISYIGEIYEFRRSRLWESDDNPGHGASLDDHAGIPVAGNSFDYPSVHGRSLLQLGFDFCSCSSAAFCGLGSLTDTAESAGTAARSAVRKGQCTSDSSTGQNTEDSSTGQKISDDIKYRTATTPGDALALTNCISEGSSSTAIQNEALTNCICGAGDGCKTVILDLICGKQVTTKIGAGNVENRYEVFPERMQTALREWTAGGGSVLISGANIATDAWDRIYPIDEPLPASTQEFIRSVLGYKYVSSFGSPTGAITTGKVANGPFSRKTEAPEMPFWNEVNTECYCVECPGSIAPAGLGAKAFLRYTGTGNTAGVLYKAGDYKVAAIGVPIECLKEEEDRTEVLRRSLEFILKK